jgi:hypothetical protein
LGDTFAGYAELGEHLIGVLAERWRRVAPHGRMV